LQDLTRIDTLTLNVSHKLHFFFSKKVKRFRWSRETIRIQTKSGLESGIGLGFKSRMDGSTGGGGRDRRGREK